eukprot:s5462_g1.t1
MSVARSTPRRVWQHRCQWPGRSRSCKCFTQHYLQWRVGVERRATAWYSNTPGFTHSPVAFIVLQSTPPKSLSPRRGNIEEPSVPAAMASGSNASTAVEPKICEPGGSGLLLPLSQAEQTADKGGRAVIYILLLLYMFMGVGTVADCFMNAVEKIISQKKRKRITTGIRDRWVTYLVWNSTVADLTLLALGSSAPEILLSILEIMGAGFYSGELGPSTIVGSAAFNLLIILAVCIVAIPAGESRAIEHMSVYHVTVLFGIFAYLWLLLIVQVISPNVVEIWEALITKLEFMSLEKKSEEETGLLAASVAEREPVPATNMRKSHHPRLPNATSSVAGNRRASQLSATRASQSPAGEAAPPKEAAGGQEDQPTPAGCMNGKDVNDPKTSEALAAPNGVITFRSDYVEVNNGETSCAEEGGYTLHVEVLRFNGCEGRVSCKMELEGLSAVPGKDFLELADNQLVFESGETSKQVPVKILQQRPEEPDDLLQLVLSEVEGPEEGGVMFNPHDDGGREMALLTIAIKNSPEPPLTERIIDPDNFRRGLEEWKEQILSSIKLEEPEAEENEDPHGASGWPLRSPDPPKLGPMDYVLFVVGLPFKVFFGLVCPPACWAGGYLLFVVALVWVGIVTALISDLASLFGCCAGLPDATTAITVVAMGTSLPDTFASMASAAKDDTAETRLVTFVEMQGSCGSLRKKLECLPARMEAMAAKLMSDSSIVNVTGSNSVNVYLGIGIPWLAAALYWTSGPVDAWRLRYADLPDVLNNYPNGAFVVKAGALGFSVLLFNCVGVVCLVVLRVRRLALGGELGGPKRAAWGSSITLFTLWAVYIASSIWRNSSEDAEVMVIPCAVLAVLAVIGGVAFELSGKFRQRNRKLMAKPPSPDNGKLEKNVDAGLEPKMIGASEDMIVPNALDPHSLVDTPGVYGGREVIGPLTLADEAS